ncbi:tetratricopeptide repeat protein [Chamaesiphon minutus]|uniref:Tetratricopeptide repeat protein n=1 Tax=Chamaesiphon minutus (strain ATCC 27169 / PCC 6605) TaxID=1173020 RepID=K9UNA1_CHAP6|nr:tetratricopeptide repeat protein [Chamaesiphon minutus]AFY95679.1 tetratricopeptide repeat protein [Chamaesiphon minutus PCC 6605]
MDKTLDRAWILMGSNRFERSEQEIRKHLSENPDDARAHTMLAMCLFDLSRHDEAIESAKKAIELVPENPYPYWVLGFLYIRLQQLDPAEEYLSEAIELNPECPDFYASLSELYWLRGCSHNLTHEKRKKFLEKGVEASRKSLAINPEHISSILYLIKNLLVFEENFCFYNIWGLQIYPTGISLGATMVGLVIMIEGTYTEFRIWFNPHYRKYLISSSALIIKLFWSGLLIISLIGLNWSILPVFIIKFLTLLLWFCLPALIITLFFLMRRYIIKD